MTVQAAEITPLPGPRWTPKRFTTMLEDCYGVGPRGGLNVGEVARYTGVSAGTVRRWTRPGNGPYKLGVGRERIEQLQRGERIVEVHAQERYQYALRAIDTIDSGEGVLAVWEQRGWLRPQEVSVVELGSHPWHQVVITRAFGSRRPRTGGDEEPSSGAGSGRAQGSAAGRRQRHRVDPNTGTDMSEIERLRQWEALQHDRYPITSTFVPHWFYAETLAYAVMTLVQNWRVHPSRAVLAVGRTRVWMADAPEVNLAALCGKLGIPHSAYATKDALVSG